MEKMESHMIYYSRSALSWGHGGTNWGQHKNVSASEGADVLMYGNNFFLGAREISKAMNVSAKNLIWTL